MDSLFRPLLEGLIDYAGLFPPAREAMPDAVRSYVAYRAGSERWVVNRFLCPAGRLAELAGLLGEDSDFGPIGVIGTGGADLDRFERGLQADAESMTQFVAALGDRAPIEAYEVRRPTGALAPVLRDLRAFDSVDVFLELPWDAEQADDLAAVAETEWLGAKARTGGIEAAAFPTAEALAGFLKNAQDFEVAFKLTAGLHHPLRSFDVELKVWHHGFLNVLAALLLNELHDLSSAEMAEVLKSNELKIEPGRLAWGEMEAVEAGEVRDFFAGYGSCSIDEPLGGLAELGILNEVMA